jgi:hypothetical protein
MSEQTAVKWLHEIAKQREPDKFDWQQAKAMEKEQIVNAVDGFPLNNRNLEGEQYYEQTYGGLKNNK